MKSYTLALLTVISIIGISCGDKSNAVSKTIKFNSAQATYSEGSGTVSIPISISSAESSNVTVNYSWTSPTDTTYLGGDFTITNIGSTVINSGSTTGSINLQIIDDAQIDGQDDIKFTLTSVSGGSVKLSPTASELSSEILINDNDTAPSDQLQVDVTWHLKDRTADINTVNLNLYSQYGVVFSGSTITSIGTTLSSGTATTGFETVFINATDTDQVYYFAIDYTTGTSNLTFTLRLHGLGFTGEFGAGDFKSADSGLASFWGPFTKSGSTVTYTGRTVPIMIFKNNGLIKLH